MNLLLIGGGGREHALAWKLRQSPHLTALYCAPGNAGIRAIAGAVEVRVDDHRAVIEACRAHRVDLVVIGPEAPLVSGLADDLRAAGIAVFGPSAAAAQLEASKAFTKRLCAERGIPTAAFAHVSNRADALAYARRHGAPLVVKADGLAGGKGVTVCETLAEAEKAISACFSGAFGRSGASVVVEEKLVGEEASFFALCDGTHALALASAQDYKRAFDGDEGPNTGGMGAVSPAPMMTEALARRIMAEIIMPTLDEMRERGTPFCGVLYAGLMITADGPKLIEYNVRFGDPECQVLMLRLRSDLLPAMLAAARGTLAETRLDWDDGAALTVVMAAKGYPGEERTRSVIAKLSAAEAEAGVTVFHAGTSRGEGGELIAKGGRVLNICATGRTAAEAQARAYRAIAKIDWPEGFYRRDIGWRSLDRKESK